MFGYIVANDDSLDENEKARWHAVYCGLCRTMGQQSGQLCRLALSFDMTFLTLLLQSLYEPAEQAGQARCAVHPATPQAWAASEASQYAGDVGVLLAYHKCLDDYNDERKLSGKAAAAALSGAYKKSKARNPQLAESIEQGMSEVIKLERDAVAGDAAPEAPANRFAQLLGEAFAWRDDMWAADLRALGARLGKFVYMMDATLDFDEDAKTGAFNPVALMGLTPEYMREPLTVLIAGAADAFERLPLEQDIHLLRSVLYAGVWQKYRAHFQKRAESGQQSGDAVPAVGGEFASATGAANVPEACGDADASKMAEGENRHSKGPDASVESGE